MGIRIGDLANERRDMVYSTSIGDLNVSYSPNALTPSDEAKLVAVRDQEGGIGVYREILEQVCKIIKSWDLEGPLFNTENGLTIVEDGERVPLDPAVLQHLPSSFMMGLYRAIGEDNVPKSSGNPRQTQNISQNNSGNIYRGSFS